MTPPMYVTSVPVFKQLLTALKAMQARAYRRDRTEQHLMAEVLQISQHSLCREGAMSWTMWPLALHRREMALLCVTGFLLAACGSSERDRIAKRIEPDIAPAHTTDAGERRAIAETMADDVIALRQEAQQAASAEAEAARKIELQNGTVEDAMARDCAMMRLELDILQKPATEIRTAEEIAAIPKTIEELTVRLKQNCEKAR